MEKLKLGIISLLIMISNTLFSQLPSYLPASGLVGWWPFNGNANDESGNGNNGVVNGATPTMDRFSNAESSYQFSGDTSFIQLTSLTNQFTSGSISTSLWFRKLGNFYPNAPRLIDFGASHPGIWSAELDTSSDVIIYYWPPTGSIPSPQPVFAKDFQWHHLLISINSTANNTQEVYIDGELRSSSCCTVVDSSQLTLPWLIGTKNNGVGGDHWNGEIDDIAIWNRPMTASEVHDLFQANCTLTASIASASSSTLVCQGDTIPLSANTNASCKYQWYKDGQVLLADTNSILSVTSAGWYTIKAKAGVCLASDSIQITQLSSPSVNAGPDLTVCAGASVIISGSGAASSYSWNQGVQDGISFVPTATASYILTGLDSNGCAGMDTVIVNVVGNMVHLELYSNSDGAACNGAATIFTGYSSDFGVQWSNGQNTSINAVDTCFTLCPGPFSVLITDNSNLCSYSLSGIMQNTNTGVDPLATYLNISNTSNNAPCNGSANILAYGGTPPYQYQFVNSSGIESTSSADSLCSGIYTFKVFDSQMDSSIINFLICDSANIITNDNPIYQDSVIVDTLIVSLVENCDIDFATIDSVWIDSYSFIGTDSLIVYWNINDANGIHQVINRYNVTNCSGVFNLELSLFCSQKSTDSPYIKVYDQVYINTQEAGIEQLSRVSIKVWPNPFYDELYVQWNAAAATDYFLLDAFGRIIQKGTLIPGEQYVDLKDVHKGLYLLKTDLKSSRAFTIVKM